MWLTATNLISYPTNCDDKSDAAVQTLGFRLKPMCWSDAGRTGKSEREVRVTAAEISGFQWRRIMVFEPVLCQSWLWLQRRIQKRQQTKSPRIFQRQVFRTGLSGCIWSNLCCRDSEMYGWISPLQELLEIRGRDPSELLHSHYLRSLSHPTVSTKTLSSREHGKSQETLRKNFKKKILETRTGGTLGTYMKIFEKEDFRLPLKADGFRACRGNRHTHTSTDVWQKENLEYDTLQSLLFLYFLCFHVQVFFLDHLFLNCLFWGVQFLLHTQKLTLFWPHTAAAENKGSMLHQTNRWARRQASCWLHVGCGTAASYSSSIRSKFGIVALFVTFTRIVYLS